MPKTTIKGAARELILDTTEQLFAEQGVEAVSLRAINAAAGVSPGVLHYHFGNRESLVTALLRRRMPALMARRREMLLAIKDQADISIASITRALVMPLAEFVLAGESGQRYIKLMAQLYADRCPQLDSVSRDCAADTTRLLPELLMRACPQLDRETISWRMAAANHAMLQTLAELTPAMRS